MTPDRSAGRSFFAGWPGHRHIRAAETARVGVGGRSWPRHQSAIRASAHCLVCLGGWGGDVDIHLHILPATRQPRRPSLYIGTIPGNGRL